MVEIYLLTRSFAPINHQYMFDSRYQCDRADMPSKLPVAARDQELPPLCVKTRGTTGIPGMMGDVFVVHLNYPIDILCLVPCFTKIKDNSASIVYWNMLLTGAEFKLQLAQALIIAGLKNHDSLKRRTSQPSLFNINRQVEKLWNQHPFHLWLFNFPNPRQFCERSIINMLAWFTLLPEFPRII